MFKTCARRDETPTFASVVSDGYEADSRTCGDLVVRHMAWMGRNGRMNATGGNIDEAFGNVGGSTAVGKAGECSKCPNAPYDPYGPAWSRRRRSGGSDREMDPAQTCAAVCDGKQGEVMEELGLAQTYAQRRRKAAVIAAAAPSRKSRRSAAPKPGAVQPSTRARRSEPATQNQDVSVIPIYADMLFSLPEDVDLKSGGMASTVTISTYYNPNEVERLYGDQKDDFRAVPVFTNLAKRDSLVPESVDGVEIEVECGRGHCSEHIPNGPHIKATQVFTGEFVQEFDLEAYPFDTQEFTISFEIKPVVGSAAMYTAPHATLAYSDKAAVGPYFFYDVKCQSEVNDMGISEAECTMKGERMYGPVVINIILPSVVFCWIALATLAIPFEKHDARLGGGLFSLVVLTVYRDTALSQLPEGATNTWLDLYLFLLVIWCCFVLFVHMAAEQIHRKASHADEHVAGFFKAMTWFLPVSLLVAILIVSLDTLTSASNGASRARSLSSTSC
jgi:hypothetical protein